MKYKWESPDYLFRPENVSVLIIVKVLPVSI